MQVEYGCFSKICDNPWLSACMQSDTKQHSSLNLRHRMVNSTYYKYNSHPVFTKTCRQEVEASRVIIITLRRNLERFVLDVSCIADARFKASGLSVS